MKNASQQTKIKVLVTGMTNADSKAISQAEETCSTSVITTDQNYRIITDPGVLKDRKILIDALEKEGLKPEEITHIFLTHSHIDHYRNIGIFPDAKVIEYWGIWNEATVDDRPEKLTDNISIIETPGHSRDGLTMLVKTDEGTIAICGDVFWKENYPEIDPYAEDLNQLKKSRELVLQSADFVIPGHGKMFKVKK